MLSFFSNLTHLSVPQLRQELQSGWIEEMKILRSLYSLRIGAVTPLSGI